MKKNPISPKTLLAIILTVAMLFTFTACSEDSDGSTASSDTASGSTSGEAAGEPFTEVTFRIVLEREKVGKLAEANIALCQYTDDTYSTPMQGEYGDIFYRINNIPRESPWQKTVKGIPHGYYKIIDVNFSNNWKISFDADEPCFEVKGDKMTVYIGSPERGSTVDMPEQWLVYGEDTQNFGIWAED